MVCFFNSSRARNLLREDKLKQKPLRLFMCGVCLGITWHFLLVYKEHKTVRYGPHGFVFHFLYTHMYSLLKIRFQTTL